MHIAVAPAHRAQRRAEVGAHRLKDGFPEGQTARGVADEGRVDVALAQGGRHGHAQRLLAPAQEDAPDDLPAPVKTGEFLV
jgi:hypothetical protein